MPSALVNISFEGDSLTNGANASSGAGTITGTVYPAVAMTSLTSSGPTFTGHNLGVNGRRLDQMLTTRDYAATYDPDADLNILCLLGGTNDINEGADPATTYSRLLADVADGISLGYTPIVLTILPSGVSGGFNATRSAVNVSIRAGAAAHGYTVADVAADSHIGIDGSETNATYFNASDQTHLTDAGDAILASYAVTQILALVAALPVFCEPMVAPSGLTPMFLFTNPMTGNPTKVVSISDNDEARSLIIAKPGSATSAWPFTTTGLPPAGSFVATFVGHTATIPTVASPPAVYFLWNFTGLTPGTTYFFSVNLFLGGGSSPIVRYETLDTDGVTILNQAILNQAGTNSILGDPTNPTPFQDPSLLTVGGDPVQWYPIGSAAFAGTTGSVRVSCEDSAGRNYMSCDNLRLTLTSISGTVAQRIDATRLPATAALGVGAQQSSDPQQVAGGIAGMFQQQGTGSGIRYLIDPAAFQTSMQGMTGIGSGNLTATGNGSPASPIRMKFVGALGGVAQSPVTVTDAAVTTTLDSAGGVLPVFTLNGDPLAVTIDQFLYYSITPDMPNVWVVLRQAPKDVTYLTCETYDCVTAGGWGDGIGGGYTAPTGIVGMTRQCSNPAGTATYNFGQFGRACTIRVSATWPHDASFSTSVVYTISLRVAGTILGTYATNQTIAPSGPTDSTGVTPVPFQIFGSFDCPADDGLIVVQTNGTANVMVSDTLRFERTSEDDSTVIGPDDVLTAEWGAGWAFTQAGPVAASGGPVTMVNHVGGQLYPALPTTTTMKVGWNTQQPSSQVSCMYTNLMRQSQVTSWADIGGLRPNPSYQYTLNDSFSSFEADGQIWPSLEPDVMTIYWDGTIINFELVATRGHCTESGSAVTGGATDNKRIYTTTGDYNGSRYGVTLDIKISGTPSGGQYDYGTTDPNLRVYHSDVVLPNPTKFDPARMLSRTAPVHAQRFLGPLLCDFGNGTDFSDYSKPDSVYSRWTQIRTITATIATIQNYSWTSGDFPRDFNIMECLPLLITTTSAHGLSEYQIATLHVPGAPNATFTSGSPMSLDGLQGFVWVLSPTTFVFTWQSFANVRMSNTLTSPGTVDVIVDGIMPIQDVIDECNEGNVDCWFQPGYCATIDCVTQIAAYAAGHLNPGLKFWVEVSNETWNNISGVAPFFVAIFGSWALYDGAAVDPTAFHCQRSKQFWDAMLPAWTGTNDPDGNPRDASDFMRVMGALGGNPGTIQGRANYCQSIGCVFDAIAPAPYVSNQPLSGSGFDSRYNPLIAQMPPGQHIDILESNAVWGGWKNYFKNHYDAVIASDYTSPFITVGYEGGPEKLHLEAGPWAMNLAKNHWISRDPRWWGIDVHMMRDWAETPPGCVMFLDFLLCYVETYDVPLVIANGTADGKVWSALWGSGCQPYVPGDPTQDAIQRNTPDRLDIVKSVTAGAVMHFGTLFDATPSPDFSIAISGSGTLTQGSSTTRTVTMTAVDGFVGTAALAATGLPSGVTVGSFSPSSLTGGGTMVATLTLNASGSATVGSSTPSVVAADSADSLTHSAMFGLTVAASTPPPTTTAARRFSLVPTRRRTS